MVEASAVQITEGVRKGDFTVTLTGVEIGATEVIAEYNGYTARLMVTVTDDLTVVILDRPRHTDLIQDVRAAGARIRLIPDGDVAGALMTAMEDSPADVLMGVGGTPEGVLAAVGLRCMGGDIVGKLFARSQAELDLAKEMGVDFNKTLSLNDLISSDNVFFAATGITTGDFLQGVRYFKDGASTDSIVMRGLSGTVRRVISTHKLNKLQRISAIRYQ